MSATLPRPATTSGLPRRRALLEQKDGWYGIDYAHRREVRDRAWLVHLHFVPDASGSGVPPDLIADELGIERDGAPIERIHIRVLGPADGARDVIALELHFPDRWTSHQEGLGLRLLREDTDPGFALVPLSDAAAPIVRRAAPTPEVPRTRDLLARDFWSFREAMLDSMAASSPGWRERHPADLGVTLVELLAAAADDISYGQDVAGTEAYIGTARHRVSLRRHARLLDYAVSEATNGRVWLSFDVGPGGGGTLPAGTPFACDPPGVARDRPELPGTWPEPVFELTHDVHVHPELSSPQLYGWGDERIVIDAGATSVTLQGHLPGLTRGSVLVFEQTCDPETGALAASPHRHVVRLDAEPVRGVDPLPSPPEPITTISWFAEDAVPWPFATGHSIDQEPMTRVLANVGLADHGRTEERPFVLQGEPRIVVTGTGPVLEGEPPRPDAAFLPARRALEQDPRRSLPLVRLFEHRGQRRIEWALRRDLLESGPYDRHCVVEPESGFLVIRFGDGTLGRRPPRHGHFTVRLRLGSASSGHVGAGAIARIADSVRDDDGSLPAVGVTNPLPSSRPGVAEPGRSIRQRAPADLDRQERIVGAEDAVTLARDVPGVRSASARPFEAHGERGFLVRVRDEEGRAPDALLARVEAALEPARLLGTHLSVRPPVPVPLDITLDVGLTSDAVPERTLRWLRLALGAGRDAAGAPAFFAPARWDFGQDVWLGPLIRRVAAVEGVAWTSARTFRRRGADGAQSLAHGVISIGAEEVAQALGAADRPELGFVTIVLHPVNFPGTSSEQPHG